MSLATLRGVGTAAGLGAGGGVAGNLVGRLTAHEPLPSLPELGQSAIQGAELGAGGELFNRGLVIPAARRLSALSLPRYRVPQGASSGAAVKIAKVNRQLPITQLTERIPSGEPGLVPAASREAEIAAHRDALLDRVGSQVSKSDVIREISRLSFNKQAKNEAKQLVDEIFDAHYAAGGGPSMGGVAAGSEKSDLYAKAGFQAGRIRDPQLATRIASRGFRQAIEKSVPPGADRRALVALNQRLGRIKSLSKAVGASYNRGGAKLVPGLAAGAAEGIGLRRGLPLGSSLEYAALAAMLARLGLNPAVESRAALMAAHPVSQALSRALPAGLAAAATATTPRQNR
jgi:hypothetical protein